MNRGWLPALGPGALLLLAPQVPPPLPVQVENVEAFTRLYGYVRFFHPSDEAAWVDREKLAILGASRVRTAPTSGDLERELETLFRPIAPSVRIVGEGEEPDGPLEPCPDDAEDLFVIAWQHKGVGLEAGGIYDSVRTNRSERRPVAEASFGTITQAMEAYGHRGKKVRLRAAVRSPRTRSESCSAASSRGEAPSGSTVSSCWCKTERERGGRCHSITEASRTNPGSSGGTPRAPDTSTAWKRPIATKGPAARASTRNSNRLLLDSSTRSPRS